MQAQLDLLVRNYHVVKKAFKWENNLIRHLCAFLATMERQEVNIEYIMEKKEAITTRVSVFSSFRGNNLLPLATMLALDEQKGTPISVDKLLSIYEQLKKQKFKNSVYLPIVAYQLAKTVEETRIAEAIERASLFYNGMKQNHPWLTSKDDYVLAMMLGTTDLPVESTLEEIEGCYKMLNSQGFWKGNGLQNLSNILALSSQSVEEKCTNVHDLCVGLKESSYKPDEYTLPLLGVLSFVDKGEKAVQQIVEGADYLKTQPGYGMFSTSKQMRLMFVIGLYVQEQLDNATDTLLKATIGNSIQAILIAQQAATIAAVSAATASSNSSGDSGGGD
ncbi:MAG: DUF4003 family protein [Bacillaceae bacterium]